MPDYIYLLKNRLSLHQRNALERIREAAREAGMTVFLVGGAVRDLTSGSPVFDLDVTVQGNALKLKKALEKAGGTLWGEHEPSRTIFFRFPVGVSVEISTARREEYPKPGKPVYHWDTILEDLRRRDFTANAMALSLNEHSYGLLMDPLNGVADIEARQLRLVSNYGFIEDPSRLLRATRLMTRLGWQLDERTQTRFDNAKEEKYIEALSPYLRGYELEEIGHEEDGLAVLAAMEAAGWMQYLFPAWTTASADAGALEEMRKLITQLQMQGVSPDLSAASAHYLTAKLAPKDLTALKAMFVRQGFVEEWNNLDTAAKEFSKQLLGKEAATPSATWKLFTSADPQAVLWLGLTTKSPAVQARYKNFFSVWPEARQKVPYALFQEMRITPEIPGYTEMLSELFFGIIDGKLDTEEQLRAFLEPYSPPAPPPPVTVRRTRGSKKSEPKAKAPVEQDFDGDSPETDDDDPADEPAEIADDDEEEDDEPEVDLPPPPRKVSAPPAKAAPRLEVKASPVVAPVLAPVPAKAIVTPALHGDAPATSEKVHVMAKPAKATPAIPAHPPAKLVKKASPPPKANGAKSAPAKPAAKMPAPKAAPAKSAPAKPAPVKLARHPAAKPAHPVKHAVKAAPGGKKSAVKTPARSPKKAEPAKRPPAKKAAPVRKHR
jgi:tRNA nucleotidyltransferase (CCA-adding enzyme)